MIEETLKSIAESLKRLADSNELMFKHVTGLSGNVSGPVAPSDSSDAKIPVKPKTSKVKAPVGATATEVKIGIPEITQALRELINVKGAQPAKDLLAKYNAARISDLKTLDYEAFMNDIVDIVNVKAK